jgi:sarcosine oxidase, subunit gamma
MADTAVRRAVELPAAPWLATHGPLSRFVFRGDAAARAAAGRAFGVEFAETACRASSNGTRAALWLGPDEHLLLAPDGEVEAIAVAFAQALAGHAYSLVDVSHRQVAFDVRGPHAEWLLESQCPLPLNLRDFPVGMCTRSIFGKAEVVLWRPAEQVFRLEVWRSFSLYVVQMLHEVARELPA